MFNQQLRLPMYGGAIINPLSVRPISMWNPVGDVLTVQCDNTTGFSQVDAWLVERLGPMGERWNKAPTISIRIGGPYATWQSYSMADPDVAFEFKLAWC